MGTSWDIRCIDCGEDADVTANYDPIRIYEIQAIIEHAAAFAGMGAVDSDFEVKRVGVYVPFVWLAKHAGHRLRPVSEYGEVDGTCAKDYHCEHCSSRLGQCDKDVDHEGPCGKRVAIKREGAADA
jgi:hypothetical protein